MSSDPPSGGRSPAPEPDASHDPPAERGDPELGQAPVVAALGAALIEALESHLPGARQHAEATAAYAFATAVEIGWERERVELIREAAKLHDIGMVYVPVEILRKPAAEQDDGDRALLASHIEAGTQLARGAGIPEEVCGWILHTRERWDGAGPAGLRGSEVPAEARVIRVACAADLMLVGSGREATIAALRAGSGSELDPLTVSAAIAVVQRATAT